MGRKIIDSEEFEFEQEDSLHWLNAFLQTQDISDIKQFNHFIQPEEAYTSDRRYMYQNLKVKSIIELGNKEETQYGNFSYYSSDNTRAYH